MLASQCLVERLALRPRPFHADLLAIVAPSCRRRWVPISEDFATLARIFEVMKLIARFLFFAAGGAFACLAAVKTSAVEHLKFVHRNLKSIPRAIAICFMPSDAS